MTRLSFECPYGFRIQGECRNPRRLVDAARAWEAYARCDSKSQCDQQSYLSAFQFPNEFRQHLKATLSTAGYGGPCWAPYLWFDVDRADLADALQAARRLAAVLLERYAVHECGVIAFFSGSKGFHIGLSTALWAPAPSTTFHKVARRFCTVVAEQAGVEIDQGIYDRVRAFRAPNSWHPKTGVYKVFLSTDELWARTLDSILRKAQGPHPFEILDATRRSEQADADWQAAADQVAEHAAAKAAVRYRGSTPQLNRGTLEFIRRGAAVGDRHRLLFSAAANLAEFGCPPELAHALLTEAALDSGLPPKEVRRQIDCGLAAGGNVEAVTRPE